MTTTYTINFRMPVPDFMSEPWHASLQSLFQAVDGLVYAALITNNITLWANATAFNVGNIRIDSVDGSTWLCKVAHTSAVSPTTFTQDRTAHPTFWVRFASQVNPRGAYANLTAYAYYDLVYDATLKIIALCTTPYTSGAGPANLNTEAANWAFLAVFPSAATAASVTYDHGASGLTAITVQAALDEIVALLIAYEASNNAAVALKAPLASPALTGNPTAPTAAPGTNTTQLASTAFVTAAAAVVLGHFPVVSNDIGAASVIASKLASSAIAQSCTMLNGTIAQSQSGNAQTFALKTLAGTDPSATDPVYFVFRNVTANLGDYTIRSVTAALSLTIPSGQAVGFTGGLPGKLWILAIDNAGTVELAVINCLLAGPGIFPLQGWGIISTTAIAAAPSAGVAYSTTARASKPYVPIGYATWEVGTTIAIAGTWVTNLATRMQSYQPGSTPLPGTEIQKQRTSSGTATTGTTVIPVDNTIPQITEGDEYLTRTIIPTSSANLLEIDTKLQLSASGTQQETMALFQDATANALAVENISGVATGSMRCHINYVMQAGTISLTTFRARGGSSGTTTTFNGASGVQLFGGVNNSYLNVREIAT